MDLDAWIKRNESCRLKPYKDTRGHLTIGWGLNLDNGISPAEAQFLFDSRKSIALRDAAETVGNAAWLNLDQVRKCALIDMAYNLGEFGLAEFHKMLAHIRAGEWQEAGDELMNSELAKEVPTRAHRNYILIVTGQWPTDA